MPDLGRGLAAWYWRAGCSLVPGVGVNCKLLIVNSPSDAIAELLKKARNIAVVGLSPSPMRPSYGVAAYLQTHGYRIIPVNPEI